MEESGALRELGRRERNGALGGRESDEDEDEAGSSKRHGGVTTRIRSPTRDLLT